MAWVLAADDQLIELPDSPAVSGLGIGQEIPVHVLYPPAHVAGRHPGILVGRGPGPNPTPQQDQAAFPPTAQELAQIIAYARGLGGQLMRGPHFASHFRNHRNLLERTTGRTYQVGMPDEADFLRDLGRLITTGALAPIGIATLNLGSPMTYIFQGQPGPVLLTCVVRPSGEWVTLLGGTGSMVAALQFQMRFDRAFPFPFLQLRQHGGMGRVWR